MDDATAAMPEARAHRPGTDPLRWTLTVPPAAGPPFPLLAALASALATALSLALICSLLSHFRFGHFSSAALRHRSSRPS
jgi:hypothetical protein